MVVAMWVVCPEGVTVSPAGLLAHGPSVGLTTSLHWHDRSELISEAVLRKVYACELDAFFIQHKQHIDEFHGHDHEHGHDHGHEHKH